MTFFGHSSSTALDFDIGFVTDPVMGYDNKGKYPVMLMHGCNVGASFLAANSFGEDWILAANKGAVGFVAHSYYGFESNLKFYGDTFYSVGYQDPLFIGKNLGDILKETSRRYMETMEPSYPNITRLSKCFSSAIQPWRCSEKLNLIMRLTAAACHSNPSMENL